MTRTVSHVDSGRQAAKPKIDQDDDGEISREELRARHQKVASRWLDKCFQQHDENDDDQISRNEAQVRFDVMTKGSPSTVCRFAARVSRQTLRQVQRRESRPSYHRLAPQLAAIDTLVTIMTREDVVHHRPGAVDELAGRTILPGRASRRYDFADACFELSVSKGNIQRALLLL